MSKSTNIPSLEAFAASRAREVDRSYIGTQVPEELRAQIPIGSEPPHTVVAEWLVDLGYDVTSSKVAAWRKAERRKAGTSQA